MAAVSHHRAPSESVLVVGGVLAMGVIALVGPVMLGLMSAVVLHLIRLSAGRVPVALLTTVTVFDLALLAATVCGVRWAWRRRSLR